MAEATSVSHRCDLCGDEIEIMREFRAGASDNWQPVHPDCLHELKREAKSRRPDSNWHHGANQVPVSIGVAEMEEGDGYRIMVQVGRAPEMEVLAHKDDIRVADFVPCEGVSWPRLDEIMGERR